MSLNSQDWGNIHPSAYRHAAEPVRRVAATLRPRGAVRYRCPVTGSFVLVTEAATLARLTERNTRLRCVDCGEMHLFTLAQAIAAVAPAAIIAEPAKAKSVCVDCTGFSNPRSG
jgi:hypothetical protein